MNARSNSRDKQTPRAEPPAKPPVDEARRAEDARFDDEITRIMTDAADLRAERDRVRRGEDERLSRGQTAAMEDLIRNHGRGKGAPVDRDS